MRSIADLQIIKSFHMHKYSLFKSSLVSKDRLVLLADLLVSSKKSEKKIGPVIFSASLFFRFSQKTEQLKSYFPSLRVIIFSKSLLSHIF